MAKSPKLELFEVKIQRLQSAQNIILFVGTTRGTRGRRKLYGEAFMRDSWTPWIHFKVEHAKDEDALCDQFLRQLIHRGYVPLRSRKRIESEWTDWERVDLTEYDMTHHIVDGKPFQFSNPTPSNADS